MEAVEHLEILHYIAEIDQAIEYIEVAGFPERLFACYADPGGRWHWFDLGPLAVWRAAVRREKELARRGRG